MKNSLFVIAAAMAVAVAGPAFAGDVGGGIAFSNMSSVAGGATGAVNGGLTGALGGGAVASSVTQSAHSDQLAGSVSSLTKSADGMKASIVSEYQGNSWTNQTSVINTSGLAGTINLTAGAAGGFGLSSGNQVALIGYLNW